MTIKTNALADILLLILVVAWAAIRAAQAAIYDNAIFANLLAPSAVSIAILVLVYLIASRIQPAAKARILSFLAVAAIGIFCFSYIEIFFPAMRYRWQLIVWAVALCVILLVQDWLSRRWSRKPAVIAIALLYLCLLLPAVQSMWQGALKQTSTAEAGSAGADIRSNVYFFMLDAYGRSDVLRTQLGYDNSAFIANLARLGFTVGDNSFANYPITTLSVSTMLDMSYPIGPAEDALKDMENYTPVYDIINGDNAAARFFRARGYNYVHFWPNGKCDYSVEICPTHQHFLGDAVTAFLGLTPLGRLIWLVESRDNEDPVKRMMQKALSVKPTGLPREHDIQALERIISNLPTDRPHFLFARILPPHPGNSYGENCQYTQAAYTVAQADFDVARYIADSKCVEVDIVALVEKVLKADRSHPVVILQSDHGPEVRGQFEKKVADWDAADIVGRYGSLNAIRMDGGCLRQHHYPTISSANVLRLVTACLSGTTPAFLPDVSYFATYVGRPEHGLVVQVAKDSEPRKK